MAIDAQARGLAAGAGKARSEAVDASGGSAALPSSVSSAAVIVFSGALSAHATFTLDASAPRAQTIKNNTSGAYDLFVKRGSGGTA